ncbi:hypothetical protein AB1N83_007134 [Pleurotus pulmonarius]
MIASRFTSLCLLVTTALAYPAAMRLSDQEVQNYERSEPIYYYTYLPALQRRDFETQEYARNLETLEKYVDSLGLEKRGLFKSLSFSMPKIAISPMRSNSIPGPKSPPLAPPPKVEAPVLVKPAPKVEAPKPPAPAVSAPKVEPPAPVVPPPKVEAPKPPASAPLPPSPPPPPPANNPPPSPPPAPPAAPPVQQQVEASQSGGLWNKVQNVANVVGIANTVGGMINSGIDAKTATVNYETAKLEAAQAAQASSSSAQPAPTA